jgi:23S rRNA pseudouridine1911/1915/1917 synthase
MDAPREHHVLFLEAEPCRIDLYLARVMPDLSRSQIRRLIDEGQVTLAGAPVKASRILRGGEVLGIVVPPPQATTAVAEPIPLDIVHEDGDIVVVNKAAGMVVHPAPGHHSGTLVNALLAHCGDLAGVGGALRPGIVHRLDVGTTGLIIAAKNDTAHRALQAQFKRRSVEKTYLALVFGIFRDAEGVIDVAIGRDRQERTKISSRSAGDRPDHRPHPPGAGALRPYPPSARGR